MLRTSCVNDYMARNLTTLEPETGILQAVQTLIEHDIAGAPVVDKEGAMGGILTEKDCMKVVLKITSCSATRAATTAAAATRAIST